MEWSEPGSIKTSEASHKVVRRGFPVGPTVRVFFIQPSFHSLDQLLL